MARDKKKQYIIAIERELRKAEKKERALQRAAVKSREQKWKQALEEKVPENVYENLRKAFCKAFMLVFEKGTGIIEKSYDRTDIQEDHEIQNFAFQVKADQKSLKKVRKTVGTAGMVNMAITTAEGIGLGVFGIGLPDIVIFTGVLLKGVYEIALRYGFEYSSAEERLFILRLMETSMLRGEAWAAANHGIDQMIVEFVERAEDIVAGQGDAHIAEEGEKTDASEKLDVSKEPDASEKLDARGFGREDAMEQQIQKTADAFSIDMIVLKFLQGLPLAGVLGGAGNPFYYNKVMKYVEIKYRKRYLLEMRKGQMAKSS